MKKEALWLLGELPELVSRGVLDEATAERLRQHYQGADPASRLGWGMLLLAAGGAGLIGLGIILLFAHNWDDWTPEVRVALSLLPLLAGQAGCAFALRSGSRLWAEAAGVFTTLAIGASIALIAQTYQMGGDLPAFLCTWLLLAIGLVYLLDASAVASLCWLLAMGWAMASEQGPWHAGASVGEAMRLPTFLALYALPLPHLIRHVRADRGSPRVAWMLRTAIAAAVIGLAFAEQGQGGLHLLLLYAALAAAGALAGERWFGGVEGVWGNPLRSAGSAGVWLVSVAITARFVLREWQGLPSEMLLPGLLAATALLLGVRNFRERGQRAAPAIAALPVVVFAVGLCSSEQWPLAMGLAHVYVIALAAMLIRGGLREGRLLQANAGVSLLAAVVMMRFFDSDLSYVVRGVGFIITGVLFFVAIFWLRRRAQGLARRMAGGSP